MPFREVNLGVCTMSDVFTVFTDTTDYNDEDQYSLKEATGARFRQDFVAATYAESDFYGYRAEDGYVGLAPVPHSEKGTQFMLINMLDGERMLELGIKSLIARKYNNDFKPNGHIKNLVFAFWFSSDLQEGTLTLGGISHKYYEGEIRYHNINSDTAWQLPINAISVNGKVVSCAGGCNALLDSGGDALVGPLKDVQALYSQLNVNFDIATGLHNLNCNQINALPSIEIELDNVTYSITPQHYARQITIANGTYCYIAIKASWRSNWVLGTSFLTGRYTVFDYTNRKVGFAARKGY